MGVGHKPGDLLSLLALISLLGSCAASSGIGKAETEAALPAQSPAQIEAELEKDPKALAEYQAA